MRQDSGYTLIEMVTVLALFSVVSAALLTLFVSATNSEVQSNRRFQAQQNARLALSKVRREVHCASTATVYDAAGNPVTTAGVRVKLTIPNSTCRGYPEVSWCAVGSGVRWALYRKAGATCNNTGTKYVDYLTAGTLFTFYSATTTVSAKLKVNLPVNTLPSKGESYTLEDELTLRNSSRL